MKAGISSQKLMLFIRGNAMSGAPIMIGTNQLPKPPIIAGMTMKNTMIRPCAVISTFHRWSALIEALRRRRAAARPGAEILDARLRQLGAHQARDRAADDPRDDREDQVERADVLVVGRHEPAGEEARLVIGIVMMRRDASCATNADGWSGGIGHAYCPALPAPAGIGGRALRGGGGGGRHVLDRAGGGVGGLAVRRSAAEPSAPGCGIDRADGLAGAGIVPPLARTQAANCAGGTASTAIGM